MSSDGFGIISAADAMKVARYLADLSRDTAFCAKDIEDFCDIPRARARRYLDTSVGKGLVRSQEHLRCTECDIAVVSEPGDPSALECDLCGVEPTQTEVFYFVIDPARFGPPTTYEAPVSDTSFSNSLLTQGRIHPWSFLKPDEYLFESDKLGSVAEKEILQRVQKFGFVLLRLGAFTPENEILLSLENSLGPACTQQNDFEGKIKTITPRKGVAANTGDSAAELGAHVDGTQDTPLPPALLAFQYLEGATHGGHSTFFDMAHVLMGFSPDEREKIVTDLAHGDAAKCTKRKEQKDAQGNKLPDWVGEYAGALIKPVCNGSAVSVRARFDADKDAVLSVEPAYQASFDKLKSAILARGEDKRITFIAREGDIAVFDNWRVMHGRLAVSGKHARHHNRFWIKNLAARHEGEVLLGVRGLSLGLLNAVQQANSNVG